MSWSAVKHSSRLERRRRSSLLEVYSPIWGEEDWKMSSQSKIPLQLATQRVYLVCASSASPAFPASAMAVMTLGTSLLSSQRRQLSLRQSAFTQVRSSAIAIQAQRRAEAKRRISQRHCEELAQSTALSLRLSESMSRPTPTSYNHRASSKCPSRNCWLALFLTVSERLFRGQVRVASMVSGRASRKGRAV